MMFLKFIAIMTECYFYLCIFIGLLTSCLMCITFLLNQWNKFVNTKGKFLEWLRMWECKKVILEKYNFALRAEMTFLTTLEYIEDPEIRKNMLKQWRDLKDAE